MIPFSLGSFRICHCLGINNRRDERTNVMTVALALLALMIVALFSGLVLGALRREMPDETRDPVWTGHR